MKKNNSNRKNIQKRRENITGWVFIAPVLTIFLVLTLLPFLFSIFLSFCDWNFVGGLSSLKFVGLQNFQKLMSDERMWKALRNTFIYVIGSVPVSLVLALLLAYAMKERIYCKKALNTMYFIPYVCSIVAVGAVFKFLFRENGIVNTVLQDMGVISGPLKWAMDQNLTKIPIILILIWTSLGYQLLIYMAAMENVPKSLYESATIDGAGSFRQFVSITFPLISPTTFYLIIVRLIAVFKVFGSVDVFTIGTTLSSNSSMVTEIYGNAFAKYRFGYASAEAMILMLILMCITGINFWGQKKWVHY